jgi:hypothetical protein
MIGIESFQLFFVFNRHSTNYGQKKVQKSNTTIRQQLFMGIADILVCLVCQKLENCA